MACFKFFIDNYFQKDGGFCAALCYMCTLIKCAVIAYGRTKKREEMMGRGNSCSSQGNWEYCKLFQRGVIQTEPLYKHKVDF